jgi:hypothetical protein
LVVRKSLLLWVLSSFAITGVVGSSTCTTAAAAITHLRPLCMALKPGVQASQRIQPTLAAMSPQNLAKSKRDLLADINMVLQALHSVKGQMQFAPTGVRGSYNRALAVDEQFRVSVRSASTRHQITLASRALGSSTAKVVTFDAYVISQCERSVPAP